ncbi:arsenic resistance N-acetyltransferase ArsN2 [Ensifer adhaerens]|uniref:arsenic resistance N-acetyltransferase ArsN2 n=1 Tax=Ensifer adhaerens TaxID=106592 RepID=UPI001CBF50D2|nr:arsenic resistance N-acetyltransferase ArsN2 [Ensifer adhaerens]MBZ7922267.1 arsenic resistance N-acetyltransferase ArsN2 [Ensifer adhaerens]UAX90909.1 arsenic resistance N-acetyltransferase ArsN2 [Ensifer adhaerens]UAX98538.1 arsenic resistance N-acetyltransferase ArsN2 [Ensifer adhaerens]UAY05919.1 arsenic resistance N-acetyltransferase ArsN2 [Ensifer adhaerens]
MIELYLHPIPGSDPGLRTALMAANLPVDDLEEEGRQFFAFNSHGKVVGYGGMEQSGQHTLLRSLVVLPEYQGRGIGSRLPPLMFGHGYRFAMRSVFLLTETAVPFFERLGFRCIERSEAPAEILNTRQASSLCPSSATLMKLVLPEHST